MKTQFTVSVCMLWSLVLIIMHASKTHTCMYLSVHIKSLLPRILHLLAVAVNQLCHAEWFDIWIYKLLFSSQFHFCCVKNTRLSCCFRQLIGSSVHLTGAFCCSKSFVVNYYVVGCYRFRCCCFSFGWRRLLLGRYLFAVLLLLVYR